MEPRRHIVLVGMMGAGKTSVGASLATRLGLPFVDIDDRIEQAARQSIPEIFEMHGEPHFRRLERAETLAALDGVECVLALGGGGFEHDDVRARCEAVGATTIYLEVDPEAAAQRCAGSGRPLLDRDDPAAVLRRLLRVRETAYLQAKLRVPTTGRPIAAVVDDICGALDD